MAKDVDIAAHLFLGVREMAQWRAKGILPAAGSTLDENRERYIRHMREAAAGRIASQERSGLDQERQRLAREQADAMAIRNQVSRGELVAIAPISQTVISMIEVAKVKLARIPGKIAGSDQALKDRLQAAIIDALIDISETRALEAQPDADDEMEFE